MSNQNTIREHMPVVDCNGEQFATVDHMEDAATIKLTKDEEGVHHYLSIDTISSIDDVIQVACTAAEAKAQWTTPESVGEKDHPRVG